MFALLFSLMACGEKEATTEVATTETQATGNDIPAAVYPSTEEVKQVAPDGGTATVSGTDVITTTTTATTTEATQTTEDSQTGETK